MEFRAARPARRTDRPTAPNQRTFSLDSDEAYAALCPEGGQPWIPNGALPREPRSPEPEVIVEPTVGRSR
jgi:hypothetical protein